MPYAVALLVIALLTADCCGDLIDDFTTAQSNPTTGLEGAVTGAGILGTERDIILDDDKGTVVIENGYATYGSSGHSGITIEWDGEQGGNGSPEHARELPVTDFTRGGLNDRFVFDITAIEGEWTISIGVTSGETVYMSQTLFNIDSVGQLEMPFADFNSPEYLEEANGISLRLRPEYSYDSITIGAFQTVPEPSSWFLFTAAGFGLAFWYRVSRSRRS